MGVFPPAPEPGPHETRSLKHFHLDGATKEWLRPALTGSTPSLPALPSSWHGREGGGGGARRSGGVGADAPAGRRATGRRR
jgi:hypothetical protein